MNTEAPASAPAKDVVRRVLHTIPPTTRGHAVAVMGELVGTVSFLFFAFAGTQYVFFFFPGSDLYFYTLSFFLLTRRCEFANLASIWEKGSLRFCSLFSHDICAK